MKRSGKKLDIKWEELSVSEWTRQQCNSWVTAPAVLTPPLHTRVWHLPRETCCYHSTTKTLGTSSLFSARAEWDHVRWKHESSDTWPVRVKSDDKGLPWNMEVFSPVLTLHTFLCCSPFLKYLILTRTLTALEEQPSPVRRSGARAGGAQKGPGEASGSGHTGQGSGLWSDGSDTELRDSAPLQNNIVASKLLKNI